MQILLGFEATQKQPQKSKIRLKQIQVMCDATAYDPFSFVVSPQTVRHNHPF